MIINRLRDMCICVIGALVFACLAFIQYGNLDYGLTAWTVGLFFVGLPSTLASLTFGSWKLIHPESGWKPPTVFLISLLALLAIAFFASPGMFLLGTIICIFTFMPTIVLIAQGVSCALLVQIGVSRFTTAVMIASILLAIGSWWAAAVLGGLERDGKAVDMRVLAEILCWVGCVLTTFLSVAADCRADASSRPLASYRTAAIFSWSISVTTWLVYLWYISKIAEKAG
jgi:hypothetical protein